MNPATRVTYSIADTKLCILGITLSDKDYNRFLQQLKTGLKNQLVGINVNLELVHTQKPKI